MATDKEREERRLQREDKRKQKESARIAREVEKADKREGILGAMQQRNAPAPKPETLVEAPKIESPLSSIFSVNTATVPTPPPAPLPQSGTNLVNAIDAGGGGFTELQRGVSDANKAVNEELKTQAELSSVAKQTEDQISSLQTRDAVPIQTIADQERTIIPGDGSTLAGEMRLQPGSRPSAEQFYNTEMLRQDIQRKVMDGYGNIPDVVLEKLQVDDYYPNIRKDIAVGTYSGKYIGSATIFAAPGMTLPLGLYDARKRALKEAAKERQASLDKIMTIPKTEDAYQANFTEAFLKGLNERLGKNGWDPNVALRDPETRSYVARYEAKAREITKAVAYADQLLTAYKDENQYVPDEFKDLAIDIKYATIDNLQDILDNKKNMMELFNSAMIYEDLTPDVIELSKQLLDPTKMSQMPLNLRTGGKFDSETFVKERNQFLLDMKTGILGKKQYAEGVVKFFGGKYEEMIDNLVASKNGSAEQSQALKKLFASMIQEQVLIDYTDVATDDLGFARLRESQRQFDYNAEQGNYFGRANDQFNVIDKATGKTFDQAMSDALKIKDAKKREQEIAKITAWYYPGSEVKTDKNGRVYSFVPASNALATQQASPKDASRGKIEAEYWDPPVKDSNGKVVKEGKWVDYKYSIADFSKTNKKVRVNGVVLSDEDKKNWKDIDPESVYTKTIGTNIVRGYLVGKDFIALKADGSNAQAYLNSNNKVTATQLIEKPFLRVKVPNAGADEQQYNTVELPGEIKGDYTNINSKQGQMIMNGLWGTQSTKAAETVGAGDSYSGSSSSSSF